MPPVSRARASVVSSPAAVLSILAGRGPRGRPLPAVLQTRLVRGGREGPAPPSCSARHVASGRSQALSQQGLRRALQQPAGLLQGSASPRLSSAPSGSARGGEPVSGSAACRPKLPLGSLLTGSEAGHRAGSPAPRRGLVNVQTDRAHRPPRCVQVTEGLGVAPRSSFGFLTQNRKRGK